MEHTTPGRLAREYNVPATEVFKLMREMKMNVTRMGAQLNSRQEKTLRAYFENRARSSGARTPKRPVNAAPATTADRESRSTAPPFNTYYKECACCTLKWPVQSERDSAERLCSRCRAHYEQEDEPADRRIARLEAHAAMYLAQRDAAFDQARRSHEAATRAWASRSSWRAALVEVMLDHDEEPHGVCWCGEQSPCRSWRKLEEANRGIHRCVETWSSWNDKQIEEFLYGDDRTQRRRWIIDEDESGMEGPLVS